MGTALVTTTRITTTTVAVTTTTATTTTSIGCGSSHAFVGRQATFSSKQHNWGGVVTVLDDCSFRIEDFTYDGLGPRAYFWASADTTRSALKAGFALDETVLRFAGGITVVQKLPAGTTWDDVPVLSGWCVDFNALFGLVDLRIATKPVTTTLATTTTSAPASASPRAADAACTLKKGSYVCAPTALVTSEGASSVADQGIAVLAARQQKKKQNDWETYVELTPATDGGYDGELLFPVPADADRSAKITVFVNFLGPSKAEQKWTWALQGETDGQTSSVKVGGNTKKAWKWSMKKKSVAWPATDVEQLSLRIRTNSDVDACDIDYVVLVFKQQKDSLPDATTTTTSKAVTTKATTTTKSSGSSAPLRAGVTWQWQLQGTIDQSFDVDIYDIDLFDTPVATIASLQAQGRTVVCYFSAGSYEEWRSDAAAFDEDLLGSPLDGWPGERWLDVRDATKPNSRLAAIMEARLDLAVTKGCTAVEPDNIDGYSNNVS